MKIKQMVLLGISLFCINSINAVKLIVTKLSVKDSDKSVNIHWKDGYSGFVRLEGNKQIVLSSPWNRDIVVIEWSELVNNMPKFYKYPLHVSAVRAPWQKDAWLQIGSNGFMQFDVGRGVQQARVMTNKGRKELESEGWAVVD